MGEDSVLELSKHHAAGNDFVVFLDLSGRRRVSGSEARALCDRHRGLGGDGFLRASASADADMAMELFNADGAEAEMSGNGIRCLVQAALDGGLVSAGRVSVATRAGRRIVDYEQVTPALGYASVDMGRARLGPEPSVEVPAEVQRAMEVDVGNPHLVLLCSEVHDDLVTETGARLSASLPGGANVEFVSASGHSRGIHLRVYERGVGETLACGTGACAAAAASRAWGLVGDEVEVTVPGGVLNVKLTGQTVVLRGPTRRVARLSVRETDLAELVSELALGARDPASRPEVPSR